MTERKYRVTRAAELESLGIFREYIIDFCRENAIRDEISFDLQLAMDEACTNIIQHGYVGMDPGSIMLELHIGESETLMMITDFGTPFEPIPTPKPDIEAALEDLPTGGFGLYFIYSTMDSIDYQSTELGNILTLKKEH
jgi:serine/threonine-protein kinase RsbW